MNKENGIKRLNRLSVKAKEYRDENTQVVKLSQAIEVVELLDEPEKLSQEWIRNHARSVSYDGIPDETEIVYVDDLEKLLKKSQENVIRVGAINYLIDQLDEPEKPVVPKWVAEILEDDEISRPMAKLNMVIHNQVNEPESGETCNRTIEFLTERGMHLDDFICKVMFAISTNSYEVEKEPLFHMPVPYLEDAYYRNDELKGLTSFKKNSKFTQDELDERFPDIKHMAVEVKDES